MTGRRTHQGTTFAGWRSRPRPRTGPRERSNPAPQGLAAGRTPTRASQDIDVLGNLITSSNALRTAVAVVRDLGFEPEPSMDGKRLHRFVRTKDNQAIDILAPDHSPPGWKPTTVPPDHPDRRGQPANLRVITVTKGDRTTDVPVPSVLGSLILKAVAYHVDSRDRDHHAADAASLVSLITDPLNLAGQLKSSDRKRLRILNALIGSRSHPLWASLGAVANNAHTTWQPLNQENTSTS